MECLTPSDISELSNRIFEFGEKASPFKTSKDRCLELARLAITSREGYAIINQTGMLVAIETPFLWDDKKFTQIVAIDGALEDVEQLLEACGEWFDSRPVSLMLCYTSIEDTHMTDILERYEFKRQGTMLVRMKYGTV